MVKELLNISSEKTRFEKIDNRFWIFVDHSYTPKVQIEKVLSPIELAMARNAAQNY